MFDLRKFVLTALIGVIHLIIVGHVFTFGFLIDPFMKTFTIENGTTIANSTELSLTFVSSIGTVQLGLFMGLQFLTTLAFNYRQNLPKSKWSEGFVAFGIISWFCGTFFSTLTTNGEQLFGVYATLTGLGGALVYWTTLAMITDIDSDNFTLATVIVFGGVGQLLFSVVVAPYYTLDYIQGFGGMQQSWKVAMQYVAIIELVLLLASFVTIWLIRWNVCCVVNRTDPNYTPMRNSSRSLSSARMKKSDSSNIVDEEIKIFGSTNCSLRTAYWLLVLTTLTSGFAMYAPYVQLVEYMLSLDTPLTTSETTLVLMVVAIASIVGRLLLFIPSIVGRCLNEEPILWPGVLLFVQVHNAVVIGCWQVVYSYAGAMVFGTFFGLGFGIQLGTTLLLTKDFSEVANKSSEDTRNTFALNLVPISIAMAVSAVGAGTVFGAIFDACDSDGRGYLCAINASMVFQLLAVLSSAGVFAGVWRFYKR